jgi:hypothetical protein
MAPCEHGLGDIDTHDMTTVSLTVIPPLVPEVLLCDENNPQEGESDSVRPSMNAKSLMILIVARYFFLHRCCCSVAKAVESSFANSTSFVVLFL